MQALQPSITDITRDMMSDTKYYADYSRWEDNLERYEIWSESVGRVMNMHREKYKSYMSPELEEFIAFAQHHYTQKNVLGAQRALQFGGEQIFKHEMRIYNCSFSYIDRVRFFQEAMYIMLCGCGSGFSIQKHHIAKLPPLQAIDKSDRVIFTIPDSIEGWADAYGVLLGSYFASGSDFPEYKGKNVIFDYEEIRPKGAYISGGFKAPGPDGLRASLEHCRELLEKQFTEGVREVKMRPIVAYDFVMHMSDAVLSGGVRRSATICLFSKDDEEMLNAKTDPDWRKLFPHRQRSNNSAVLKRDELTIQEWMNIINNTKAFGEPGFYFVDDLEQGANPCCEIGLRAYDQYGQSGWQMCNL